MLRGSRLAGVLALVVAGSVAAPRPAAAFGHLWEISEVYSNADGTLQFVEFVSDVTNENLLSLMFLRSVGNAQDFHFPSDLAGNTLNRHMLVATAAFAAQPGAVTPDYVIPDGFIRIQGDTLSFRNEGGGAPPYSLPEIEWDHYTFAPGVLPTDGTNSIHRDHAVIEIEANSPTNYAGQTGSVTPIPEPASALLLAAGLASVAASRRRA